MKACSSSELRHLKKASSLADDLSSLIHTMLEEITDDTNPEYALAVSLILEHVIMLDRNVKFVGKWVQRNES